MRNAILVASLIFAAPVQAAGLDDTLRAIFNGPGPAASVYWTVSKHRTHKPIVRPVQHPPEITDYPHYDRPGFTECISYWYADNGHGGSGYGDAVCHEIAG